MDTHSVSTAPQQFSHLSMHSPPIHPPTHLFLSFLLEYTYECIYECNWETITWEKKKHQKKQKLAKLASNQTHRNRGKGMCAPLPVKNHSADQHLASWGGEGHFGLAIGATCCRICYGAWPCQRGARGIYSLAAMPWWESCCGFHL